jgi:hypothetical protein
MDPTLLGLAVVIAGHAFALTPISPRVFDNARKPSARNRSLLGNPQQPEIHTRRSAEPADVRAGSRLIASANFSDGGTMNENRRQILEMLSAGQITADEAERLLTAVEKELPAPAAGTPATPKPRAKYLRVLVDADNDYTGAGPTKVNIRVPTQLLRAGVRLTGLIPVQARTYVNDALREKGIPFDLNQIRPENLEEIIDQLDDIAIDVDQNEKVKVRVFAE